MSPEQWVSARDVGPAADQWALATILFELVAGVPPFEGELLAHICTKVLNSPPPSLHQLRPDIPPGLEQILLTALHKSPTKRYPNIAAFATAIAPFGSNAAQRAAERIVRMFQQAELIDQSQPGVSLGMASSPGLGGAPPSFDPPAPFPSGSRAQTAQSWQQVVPPQHKSRRALLAGLAAMVVLIGVLLVVVLRQLGVGEDDAGQPAAAEGSSVAEPLGQDSAEASDPAAAGDPAAADDAEAGGPTDSASATTASAAVTVSTSSSLAASAQPPTPAPTATTSGTTAPKTTTKPKPGWSRRKRGSIFDDR